MVMWHTANQEVWPKQPQLRHNNRFSRNQETNKTQIKTKVKSKKILKMKVKLIKHLMMRTWKSVAKVMTAAKKLETSKKILNQAMRTKGSHKFKITKMKKSQNMKMITVHRNQLINLNLQEMTRMMKLRMDLTQKQEALTKMIEKMLKKMSKMAVMPNLMPMKEVKAVVIIMKHQKPKMKSE